jgi:hypothetical protein
VHELLHCSGNVGRSVNASKGIVQFAVKRIELVISSMVFRVRATGPGSRTDAVSALTKVASIWFGKPKLREGSIEKSLSIWEVEHRFVKICRLKSLQTPMS